MRFINLTKQPLILHDTTGEAIEIPPDPRHVGLVSVADHRTVGDGNGREFSLTVQRVRGVKGMPEPEEGMLYVVPVEIAMALHGDRKDVAYLAEDVDVRMADGQARRISHLRRLVVP